MRLKKKIKDFALRIIEKYTRRNVKYYESAYMVLLIIRKENREGIVPLYAGSRYITNQIHQYREKEIIREIYHKTEVVKPVDMFRTGNPARFFENINISTRREWGRIFYSFSKEYEAFYKEQYHRQPDAEAHVAQTVHISKKEIRVQTEQERENARIISQTREQLEEKELRIRRLEERIDVCLQRIVIQEELTGKKHIREPGTTGEIGVDVRGITQSVLSCLQTDMEQERMRYGK